MERRGPAKLLPRGRVSYNPFIPFVRTFQQNGCYMSLELELSSLAFSSTSGPAKSRWLSISSPESESGGDLAWTARIGIGYDLGLDLFPGPDYR